MLDDLLTTTKLFMVEHAGAYMGFSKQLRISRAHGLRALWEDTSSLPIVRYWQSVPKEVAVGGDLHVL